jgi:hypothetical protein
VANRLPDFPKKTHTNQQMYDALVNLRAYLEGALGSDGDTNGVTNHLDVPTLSGNNTFTGTYNEFAKLPSAFNNGIIPVPTNPQHLTTKQYVDSKFTTPVILAQDVDFNNLRTQGIYRYGFTSNLSSNSPLISQSWFFVQVIANGDTHAEQIYYNTENRIFIRKLAGSPAAWGAWAEVLTSANTPPNVIYNTLGDAATDKGVKIPLNYKDGLVLFSLNLNISYYASTKTFDITLTFKDNYPPPGGSIVTSFVYGEAVSIQGTAITAKSINSTLSNNSIVTLFSGITKGSFNFNLCCDNGEIYNNIAITLNVTAVSRIHYMLQNNFH